MAIELVAKHEVEYMEKDWMRRPLIEHIDHVWYDHGNLFSSQVREEMNDDEHAMELVENFEEAWRELHEYVNDEIGDHREKIRKEEKREKLKERLKPFIHKEIEKIRSRQ